MGVRESNFRSRSKMNRLLMALFSVILLVVTPISAQEKVVDNIMVELGVLSWKEIQEGIKEKPATHTEEFHRKMAKAMSEMHAGDFKDAYHVMIMLTDRVSGVQVGDADVWVAILSKTGPEELINKLKPMTMDGYSGYGEFFRMTYGGPYVFKIRINRKDLRHLEGINYNVEFENIVLQE